MNKFFASLLLFFSANALAVDKFDAATGVLNIDAVVLNGTQYNNVAVRLDAYGVMSVGSSLQYAYGVTFIPGTYTYPLGETCKLSNVTLPSGREQVSLACQDKEKYPFSATWVNGPIKGNPFQVALQAAGIDKLPASTDYAWGEMTSNVSGEMGCFGGVQIISATQIGNSILLTNYDAGNDVACTVSLTLK